MRKAFVWIACAGLAACFLQTIHAEPGMGKPAARLDAARGRAYVENGFPAGGAVIAASAAPYVFDFEVIDGDQDGKISEYECKDGCHGGSVKEGSTGTSNRQTATLCAYSRTRYDVSLCTHAERSWKNGGEAPPTPHRFAGPLT
jgi:hypothetical protein